MSMTKPVTGVAVMMLAEEGRLALTDSVEKHLPELRGLKVISERHADGSLTLRKPSRLITLRDLLTHTSGLPEYRPEGGAFYSKMNLTLAEAVLQWSQSNLLFEPGTKWQYSNPGIAALGRIVEVTSGQKYEDFLAERIFTPLGMTDSFFFPPAAKHARIADVMVGMPNAKPVGMGDRIFRKGSKYPMPEGGLYSTATDLLTLSDEPQPRHLQRQAAAGSCVGRCDDEVAQPGHDPGGAQYGAGLRAVVGGGEGAAGRVDADA